MADDTVKDAFKEYQALRGFGHTSPWFGGLYAAMTIHDGKEDKVFGRYNGVLTSYDVLKKMLSKAEDDLAKFKREGSPAVAKLNAENAELRAELAKLKTALRQTQEELGNTMAKLKIEIDINEALGDTMAKLKIEIDTNEALSERLGLISNIVDGNYEIE